MSIGPTNSEEAVIFAVEDLRASIQYSILKGMKECGVSQAQLARRLGVSPAWVSQILSDDANLTLESVAKVFLALDMQCEFGNKPVSPQYKLDEVLTASVSEWEDTTSNIKKKVDYNGAETKQLLSVVSYNYRQQIGVTVNDNSRKRSGALVAA